MDFEFYSREKHCLFVISKADDSQNRIIQSKACASQNGFDVKVMLMLLTVVIPQRQTTTKKLVKLNGKRNVTASHLIYI